MLEVYLLEAFFLVLLCSGIPLVVSSVVGVFVSVIQASTQIQEQTITYFAKLIAVSATIAVLGAYFSRALIEFLQHTLASLSSLGRL